MIPTIINDTYRKFPDGREVCLPNKKGRDEYRRRREQMVWRQGGVCACGCGRSMTLEQGFPHSGTFNHNGLRGKDIDERIEKPDPDNPGKALLVNCAMRAECNLKLGSKRRTA